MDANSDQALLELAAKAAGIEIITWSDAQAGGFMPTVDAAQRNFWNPLRDDGDALRLAVKLKFDVLWAEHERSVVVCNDSSNDDPITEKVRFTDDPYAATRRAIVRAAAEIGKAMV